MTQHEPVHCVHCGVLQDLPAAAGTCVACPACSGLAIVAGRYRLGHKLGAGGMGEVYEALDSASGARVAVKVVGLDKLRDWKAVELFERGTRLLENLRHPGVPSVLSFEHDAAGRAYQVREVFDGGQLEARIRAGARFDRRQVHHLLKHLLETLEYLHSQLPPIVHRDIKPSNVMFRSAADLRPVLVDFDTAGAIDRQGTSTTIVVSPGYTAPEQLVGNTQPTSDLYSLGMTMLFVLTHQHPIELARSGARLVVDDILGPLEPATRHVIERLIEPSVDKRYASARAALLELAGMSPLRTVARSSRPPGSWNKPLEFGGVSLFRIAVGVLLGVAVGYLVLARWAQARNAQQDGQRSLQLEAPL